jgi:uncharacterized protein YfdQ (DUF2303 family)
MNDSQELNDIAQTAMQIATLAREGVLHKIDLRDGRQLALVHKHFELKEVAGKSIAYGEAPPRIRASVTLTTADSFVDYLRDFGQGQSRGFASLEKDRIEARLDYHTGGSANFCEHAVALQLQRSEEWRRWDGVSKQLMPQADFARFLEENLGDIERPSGADVLEIVRDLSATQKVDFRSAVRLDNGDVRFDWAQETTARSKTGDLDVPRMFVLRIPVFYGAPSAEVHAFLRWRLEEGAIKLGIELHRPVYVLQATFEQIVRDIAERSGVMIHFGALSAS